MLRLPKPGAPIITNVSPAAGGQAVLIGIGGGHTSPASTMARIGHFRRG